MVCENIFTTPPRPNGCRWCFQAGSKVTAILLNGWILSIGGASAVKGLRLQPAQHACFLTTLCFLFCFWTSQYGGDEIQPPGPTQPYNRQQSGWQDVTTSHVSRARTRPMPLTWPWRWCTGQGRRSCAGRGTGSCTEHCYHKERRSEVLCQGWWERWNILI